MRGDEAQGFVRQIAAAVSTLNHLGQPMRGTITAALVAAPAGYIFLGDAEGYELIAGMLLIGFFAGIAARSFWTIGVIPAAALASVWVSYRTCSDCPVIGADDSAVSVAVWNVVLFVVGACGAVAGLWAARLVRPESRP